MSKTVFVAGGAGYVGAHCCKAFAQAGWKVVVYDNLSRGWRDFVKWGPLIEGDILDYEALSAAMAQTAPDIVAHFAAMGYVSESTTDPALQPSLSRRAYQPRPATMVGQRSRRPPGNRGVGSRDSSSSPFRSPRTAFASSLPK